MKSTIEVNPRPVVRTEYGFGNIASEYDCNNLYFTYDGKPKYIIAGELHFSRMDRRDWRQELLKLKDSGLCAVSTYVFWNFHEKSDGVFDFNGDLDIRAFLEVCKSVDMAVILRIGPWCHGEVINGGFPDYIVKLPAKRTNNPKYLTYVSRLFTKIYEQIGDYCDGITVLGIQLENEYGGNIEHIRTLRNIAEKIGFKTPFFTMTLWPSNCPDNSFLPMCGGYPEAPWTQNKKPLEPKSRFKISPGRTETEIGTDLIASVKIADCNVDAYPYASCEIGPGNQVTQHRRPIIGDKDGYGVGFARFASGMNWLGYYMYHGGRNPIGRMLQENRLSFYPNNYPIVDYDFQAPISRYGYVRQHGDRLRLLHTFINTFDSEIALKQPFFPQDLQYTLSDVSPTYCVRCDAELSGYFFASAYERGVQCAGISDLNVTVTDGINSVELPGIDLKSDAMIFYPFNVELSGLKFDYILAQPITKIVTGNTEQYYFVKCEGIAPRLSVSGSVTDLPLDEVGYRYNNKKTNVEIIVLSETRAFNFHNVNGHAVFTDATAYGDDDEIIVQSRAANYLEIDGRSVKLPSERKLNGYALKECSKVKGLKYNHFLYSHGKRKYYELKVDRESLNDYYDVVLEFKFTGLNLQVFADKLLINDYFNTNGRFVMSMRQHARFLNDTDKLIIRAVPQDKYGSGKVYNEIAMPFNTVELELIAAVPITATAHNLDVLCSAREK